MEEKRTKISEFINSMEGEELNAATCIVGGAAGGSVSPMSTTNGTDCTNPNKDACNKSTNDGACKNYAGYCNSSKNGGSCNSSCNNGYDPGISSGPIQTANVKC